LRRTEEFGTGRVGRVKPRGGAEGHPAMGASDCTSLTVASSKYTLTVANK